MSVHSDGELDVGSCPSCSGVWVRHSSLVAFKSLATLIPATPGLRESLAGRRGRQTAAFGEEPVAAECPTCGHGLMPRTLADHMAARVCIHCGGAWLEEAAVAELLWTGGPALPAQKRRSPTPVERFDRFTFHDPLSLVLALPLASLAAIVINQTFLVGLFRPLHIWIHEFGHASVAWFSGRRALPLPIGWTSWQPDRNVVVYAALAFLLGVLLYTAWKERLRATVAIAGLLLAVQGIMTWTFSQKTVELWITFGGIGGEFLLSTALMLMFYFRLPDRFRWDFWRYPVLIVASSTLWENVAFWTRVGRGTERIPWGSILGAGDAGGDMDRLVLEHNWSSASIVSSYNGLGTLCLVALAVGFVGFLLVHWARIVERFAGRKSDPVPTA